MLILSDDILLSKIVQRGVYLDRKSIEKHTGKIGKKYKVAGNCIPEINFYFFFVTSSSKSAYGVKNTISVLSHEWIDKESWALNGVSQVSYTHFDKFTSEEVLEKIKDPYNGFKSVAQMTEAKFKALVSCYKKNKVSARLSSTNQALLDIGLSEDDIVNEVAEQRLRELGI